MRIVPVLALALVASGASAQQAPRPAQARPAARKPAVPTKVLSPVEQRIQAVENNLLPSIRVKGRPLRDMTVAARMKTHAVTGVSVAVINDYAIEWARAYGTADTAKPLAAGSVAEPVMAAVAMAMVQGKKVDLDRDVNRSLRKWKIPKSDFTKTKAVTLGALLSHMSGVSRLPSNGTTLGQVLAGLTVEQIPTLEYRPWGADYAIVEQLLADVAKKPFADVAGETVLGPLGLSRTAFRPPLAVHGLWTTPTDLARFALEVQFALSGRPARVLNTPTAITMITPAAYSPAGFGLVPAGRDSILRFDHRGRADGSETEMVAFAHRGQGAVVMATGGVGAGRFIVEILNAIGKTYGWPNYVPADKVVARIDPRVFDRYTGTYTAAGNSGVISRRGTKLFFAVGKNATELLPESVSDFFTAEGDAIYSFVFDENARVSAMTVKRREGDARWDRTN